MSDDADLLRRYSTNRDEGDFAEIVRRHLGLVYHTALRRVDGDVHLAEDVSQQVFVTLAQNARSLAKHPALAGWLYVATRNAAANTVRGERRRRVREQEAHVMMSDAESGGAQLSWDRVQPELERMLDELPSADRAAVLLRYYENRPFAEIGESLRLSENAARMRVDRALDRLRSLLERRGIQSTSAALAALLCQEAATAAPAGLVASVTSAVVASAAAPASAISTVSILATMNTSKVIVGLSGVIACASLGTAVFQHVASREAKAALGSAITDRDAVRQKLEAAVAAGQAARADAESAFAKAAALEKELQERSAKQAESVTRPSHAAARPTAAMTNEFTVLMKNPAYQQAWLEYNRAGYRQRYGRLYRKLHLSPEQIASFEATLQELNLASADTIAAAQSQGVPLDDPIMPRAQVSNSAMRDAATKLRTLLGEAGHAEYLAFQSEAQINSTVDAFAGNLYYTDAPLTADQADRLTGLIRAHTKAGPKSGIMWTGPQVDWAVVLEQSRGLLAAPQLEVLRRTVEQNELGNRMTEIRQSIMASMLAEAAQKPPTDGE